FRRLRKTSAAIVLAPGDLQSPSRRQSGFSFSLASGNSSERAWPNPPSHAQLQRDFLRRRAALYGDGAGRIAGTRRRNGQVAAWRKGADAAGTRRRRGRTVDSRSLHAGAFPGGVGAASNRSDATRHPNVYGARRGRKNRQTDIQTYFCPTCMGAFCSEMRRLICFAQCVGGSTRNLGGSLCATVILQRRLG